MGKTNADGTTYTDPLTEVTTSVNSAGEVTGVTEGGDPTSSLLVHNPVTELADDAAEGDATGEPPADEAPAGDPTDKVDDPPAEPQPATPEGASHGDGVGPLLDPGSTGPV